MCVRESEREREGEREWTGVWVYGCMGWCGRGEERTKRNKKKLKKRDTLKSLYGWSVGRTCDPGPKTTLPA